ncbi:hypothetical protein LZC95_01850 [Pendulispora brunnea]|uniref:Uncharacterized protein n=1 Tax=Pendulispora brunnea TaxID=2905690 RepID=A0ABZ2KES6_9BACT
MPTYFRERYHTPLSREEAAKVLSRLVALVDAYATPGEDREPAFTLPDSSELEGLSVLTTNDLRDEEEDVDAIADDLSMDLEKDAPPSAERAREIAAATGYVPDSLILEPMALERLATCRSTIVFRYPGRVGFHPFFLDLQRKLLEAIGPSVVESGDGSSFQPSEFLAAELAEEPGPDETTKRKRQRKPPRRRDARAGEVETLSLRNRLLEMIDDPLAKGRLFAEFSNAEDGVRRYASLLLEDGAQSDAHAAKALGLTAKAVAAHRMALAAMLDEISND